MRKSKKKEKKPRKWKYHFGVFFSRVFCLHRNGECQSPEVSGGRNKNEAQVQLRTQRRQVVLRQMVQGRKRILQVTKSIKKKKWENSKKKKYLFRKKCHLQKSLKKVFKINKGKKTLKKFLQEKQNKVFPKQREFFQKKSLEKKENFF